MTIYTPNPPSYAAKLREALNALGDALRLKGAEVELVESGGTDVHATTLLVTMHGSIREAAATSIRLKQVAEKTGGVACGTLLTPETTGVPEGEYRVALLYQMAKPPRVRTRRRAN